MGYKILDKMKTNQTLYVPFRNLFQNNIMKFPAILFKISLDHNELIIQTDQCMFTLWSPCPHRKILYSIVMMSN